MHSTSLGPYYIQHKLWCAFVNLSKKIGQVVHFYKFACVDLIETYVNLLKSFSSCNIFTHLGKCMPKASALITFLQI